MLEAENKKKSIKDSSTAVRLIVPRLRTFERQRRHLLISHEEASIESRWWSKGFGFYCAIAEHSDVR